MEIVTDALTILHGDCREKLAEVPAGSVQCCVTSPPYWGLRSYLKKGHAAKHLEIGSEPTPEAYVETIVGVLRGVRRGLHDSGTVWLNVGDSYATQGGRGEARMVELGRPFIGALTPPEARGETSGTKGGDGLKPKDLCLIPWRLAIALQADGWWVRSVICWHKKSCMPESVTDRPTNSWEPIFLLAKAAKYFYDGEAVKEPAERGAAGSRFDEGKTAVNGMGRMQNGEREETGTRNQRNVWSLGPEPYSEAHFATFPTEIPCRAILAGTSARGCCPKCRAPWKRMTESTKTFESGSGKAGNLPTGKQDLKAGETNSTPDVRMGPVISTRTIGWRPGCRCDAGEPVPCVVLDPFGGSGTTGAVALELGRHAILCELNDDYLPLIEERTDVTKGFQLA